MTPDGRDVAAAPPLRVAIDARLPHGEAGGIESVIAGLAAGLSALEGPEEYMFLGLPGSTDWLEPHLGGNSRLLLPTPTLAARVRSASRRGRRLVGAARSRSRRGRVPAGPPASDGTVERAGADVVHLAWQHGFLTRLPTIYHPHDLQHRHLPELFSPEDVAFRDRWYGDLCRAATMVAVASVWTREDVIRELRLPAEKVWVVPWAPPTLAGREPSEWEVASVKARLALPDAYLLYTAQTWPHKNHLGLVRAMAIVRDRIGFAPPLVLTGRRSDFARTVDREIKALGLANSIRWLGFLEPVELRSVLSLATAVVIPTLFEAASAPLWEAFEARVPAACSRVTSLPAQAGDAALLFDPARPEEIADTIMRLWREEDLRADLARRGKARVSEFTWDRTARLFRAHYRRLAGRRLDDADAALLRQVPAL